MGLSKIVGHRSVGEVRNVPGSCIEGTEHSCRTPLVLLAFLTEVNNSSITLQSIIGKERGHLEMGQLAGNRVMEVRFGYTSDNLSLKAQDIKKVKGSE